MSKEDLQLKKQEAVDEAEVRLAVLIRV